MGKDYEYSQSLLRLTLKAYEEVGGARLLHGH